MDNVIDRWKRLEQGFIKLEDWAASSNYSSKKFTTEEKSKELEPNLPFFDKVVSTDVTSPVSARCTVEQIDKAYENQYHFKTSEIRATQLQIIMSSLRPNYSKNILQYSIGKSNCNFCTSLVLTAVRAAQTDHSGILEPESPEQNHKRNALACSTFPQD